jgi:hypothetical protein
MVEVVVLVVEAVRWLCVHPPCMWLLDIPGISRFHQYQLFI